MQSAPPPACRQSPVSAGIAVIARMAAPPPPCRCKPSPSRIAVGRVDAIRSPSPRTADDVEPAHLGGALDGPLGQPLLELRPADRVPRQPLTILRPGVEDGAHQAERQRGIRSRQRCDVLVRAFGGRRPDRVDDRRRERPASAPRGRSATGGRSSTGGSHPTGSRAVPARDPPGRSRPTPVVAASATWAAASQIVVSSRDAPSAAKSPRAHRPTLDLSHRSRVVERQHRLGPVFRDGGAQAVGRESDRLVPADALEPARPLLADPLERVQ